MWAVLRIYETQRKNSSLPTGHSRVTYIEAGQIITPICIRITSPTKEVYSCQWNSRCHQVLGYSFINQNSQWNYFKINSQAREFALVKKLFLIEYKVMTLKTTSIMSKTQNRRWNNKKRVRTESLFCHASQVLQILVGYEAQTN